MKKKYSISFYLDTRRKKKNGQYPVKLRVYAPDLEKQKIYATEFEFTEKDFNSIWKTTKPRDAYKDDRLELQAYENKANNVARSLKPFSFEHFERKFYRKSGEGSNVFYHYDSIIKEYLRHNRISTASNYELSMKSLKAFMLDNSGNEVKILPFIKITHSWLQNYEEYMLKEGKSRSTIAIYLRPLRAVFNLAIREGDIPSEIYPFGRSRYKIPSVRKVKKALSWDQLKKLYKAIPDTPEQEKAKDFWLLSYSLAGMNLKDIALLRNKDVPDSQIVYYRSKTINTSKANLKPISVHLNDLSNSIIEKYRNPSRKPEDFLFPIISDHQTAFQQHRNTQNFVRAINQNIKRLAKQEGLPEDISFYWARHSWATNAIRHGASMEFVAEAFNHSSLQTTQRYFSGFEELEKKEMASKLTAFAK